MNKELINKFEEEFLHCLNDKPIAYKLDTYKEGEWTETEDLKVFSESFDGEVISIVICDKYEKLRKAEAEGSKIQYTSCGKVWSDMRSIDKYNRKVENYRAIRAYPNFPAYFRRNTDGIIVRFDNLVFGVIIEGDGGLQSYTGYESSAWKLKEEYSKWEHLTDYKEASLFKEGDWLVTKEGEIGLCNHSNLKSTLLLLKEDVIKKMPTSDLKKWEVKENEMAIFWNNNSSKRIVIDSLENFITKDKEVIFLTASKESFENCAPLAASIDYIIEKRKETA